MMPCSDHAQTTMLCTCMCLLERNVVPWTVDEVANVRDYFEEHIKKGRAPIKAEIDRFCTMSGMKRNWLKIKHYVRYLGKKDKQVRALLLVMVIEIHRM